MLSLPQAARGAVIYRGPSMIDGAPVVVVAIRHSQNRKTGDVVQTYILRADMPPLDAVRTGDDHAICGACPHRGDDEVGRSCYVNVGRGPTIVWRALKAGRYPDATPPQVRQIGRRRVVRIGTYGDPGAVPGAVWSALTAQADGWRGYTHQWRTRADLAAWCMASVDSVAERAEALAGGWRTFRTAPHDAVTLDELECPNATHGVQCVDCRLCSGTTVGPATVRSIAIRAHGLVGRNVRKRVTP